MLNLEIKVRDPAVIDKTRRLFLVDHVRIHLDEVADLGTFIELEAVLPDSEQAVQTDETLERVIDALELCDREQIAGGYRELLLEPRAAAKR